MRSQYAAAIDPPPATLTVIVGSTTAASAKTYYCWLYSRTRGGITNFSTAKTVSIVTGQGISVTVPAAVKTSGADIQSIGIVLGTDSTPANGCVVASVDKTTTLPTTVNLTTDEHLSLNKHVAASNNLPAALNAKNGMRRYVDAINKIVEFDATSSTWKNASPQVFNPWVSSRLAEEANGKRGADRDLADITDFSTVIIPEYAADNSYSEAVTYWIVNDGSTIVLQGQRIRLAIATDSFDTISDDFKGLCELTFLGYVDTNTGVLDTSGMQLGSFPYQGDASTNFVTQKDLLPGYAIALSVQLHFADYHLNNRVAQGETVKVYPRLAANYSVFDPAGRDLGDRIWNVGGMRRLIPDGKGLFLKALSGSASVARYGFELLSEQIVTGLASNTANQQVAISNTGVCYTTVSTLPNIAAAKRAVVGTVDGPGLTGSWSTPVALSPTTLLNISITHPTTVRPDYPDVIAGTTALLNAGTVRVYVRPSGGGTIQYFDISTLGLDETITVGSLVTGTLAGLPTVNNNFGLFSPPAVVSRTTVAGGSAFAGGNYEFCIGYLYSGTVTSISHDPALGCIREMLGSVVDALSIRDSWGEACVPAPGQSVDDAIRNIPEESTGKAQTRRVAGNPLIFYDASLTSAEVLTGVWSDRIWRPTWRTAAQPGRWRGEITIKGEKGDTGTTPAISVASTNLASTSPATVAITGTPEAPLITFGLRQGNPGVTPAISVTATTLAYTEPATAVISGPAAAPTITFGIPQGTPGSGGGSGGASSFVSVLLDSQATAPGTGSNQLGLFNFNGVPSLRQPSSGLIFPVATVGSVSGVKNVNTLLNGSFQVAQGATSWTISGGSIYSYLADSWQGIAGTGGTATISLASLTITDGSIGIGNTTALRWAQTTQAANNPALRSRIENVATLAGQIVTLSFYASATASISISAFLTQSFGTGGSTSVSTTPTAFNVTTTRTRFSITTSLANLNGLTVGTNSSLDVVFQLPSTATFQLDIDSVELVPGNTPSFFIPTSIDKVFPSLLRYLYRIGGVAGQAIGAGRASAANTGQIAVPFPVPMRIVPTLTFNDLIVNAAAVTAAVFNNAGTNSATVEVTGTLTLNVACLLRLNSAASFIQLDARMPLT